MTISSNQVSMTATRALIVTAPAAGCFMQIVNTGSNTVYLGGASVTSSNGVALIANWIQPMQLGPNEALYGICASGQTATIGYMLTSAPLA